jgi:sortase A
MGWRVVETANGSVSEWVIPEDEAGYHINSAALGEPGNLVISGHNNIFGRVFLPISQAWDDDTRVAVDRFTDRSDVLNGRPLQLYSADGLRVDYQIEEFYRLRDTGVPIQQRIANARFMQPTDDTRVTIVTCWPPWNNTHRLVVIARPAPAR